MNTNSWSEKLALYGNDGAHGVTRPTSENPFVSICVHSWLFHHFLAHGSSPSMSRRKVRCPFSSRRTASTSSPATRSNAPPRTGLALHANAPRFSIGRAAICCNKASLAAFNDGPMSNKVARQLNRPIRSASSSEFSRMGSTSARSPPTKMSLRLSKCLNAQRSPRAARPELGEERSPCGPTDRRHRAASVVACFRHVGLISRAIGSARVRGSGHSSADPRVGLQPP